MNGAKTLSDVQEEQMQLKNDIDNLLDQNKTKKKQMKMISLLQM